MAALKTVAQSPWPLPFGALKARRSLLSVRTLADIVRALIKEASDIRGLHLIADPEPLSIGEMIATLRAAEGRPDGLVPLPEILLKALLFASGRGSTWQRIGLPLVVEGEGSLRSRFPHLFKPTREGLLDWVRTEIGPVSH